jgi:hypothetical protein
VVGRVRILMLNTAMAMFCAARLVAWVSG